MFLAVMVGFWSLLRHDNIICQDGEIVVCKSAAAFLMQDIAKLLFISLGYGIFTFIYHFTVLQLSQGISGLVF